ncbi:hypothetical protein AURDEDRAFT_148232 [Auricularia subglabra TFB-10046 SS5]|nr:hypothetical protein AURDEDRAFT_148232 [Auricularia subglabra TFB-10046 SS5]
MWAVIAVAFSECVCVLVILGITVSREKTIILPPEIPLPGCLVAGVPHLLTGAWVVNVVASGSSSSAPAFQAMWPTNISAAVYLLVTIYVVVSSVRQAGSVGQTITTLSRHGIVAFVVVLGVALFSYLWARLSRGMLVALALPWLAATLSVTSSRLVLALRSLGQAQEDKVHIIPTATATSSVRGSYDHRSLFGSTWKTFDAASARTSMEPRPSSAYEPRRGSVASAVPSRMFGSSGSAIPPRAFGSVGSGMQPRAFGSMGSAVQPRAFGSSGSAVAPRAFGGTGSAVQPRLFGSVGSSSRPGTGASDAPLLEDVALEDIDGPLEEVPL